MLGMWMQRGTGLTVCLAMLVLAGCGGGGSSAFGSATPTAGPVKLLDETEAPPVPDVATQLLHLRQQGTWLGFHLGEVAPVPTVEYDEDDEVIRGNHWQGLVRFEHGGLPWLAASIQADVAPPVEPEPEADETTDDGTVSEAPGDTLDPAGLTLIQMASRANRGGERMRSNRLATGLTTEETEPPTNDLARVHVELPSTYQLPGGMQVLGDLLLLANTNPEPAEGDDDVEFPVGHHASTSAVQFVDVSDPLSPEILDYELGIETSTSSHVNDLDTTGERSRIGTVGITQLPDGDFLLAVTSRNGRHVHVFRSRADSYDALVLDLESSVAGDGVFSLVDSWYVDEAPEGVDWPVEETVEGVPVAAFQAAGLLTQETDSAVFLLGARNEDRRAPYEGEGADVLQLFEIVVDEADDVSILNPMRGETRVAVRQEIALAVEGAGRNGSLNAGGGLYVSPSRELLYYAVEHGSVLLDAESSRFVRCAELRHELVVRDESPLTEPTAVLTLPNDVDPEDVVLDEGQTLLLNGLDSEASHVDGWVELFAEVDFGGPSVVIDARDFDLEDWDDFLDLDGPEGEGFDNQARSVRWYLPRGSSAQLFADADTPSDGEHLILPLPASAFPDTDEADAWDTAEISESFAGQVQEIADLSELTLFEWVGDELAMTETTAEDVVSSARFDPDGRDPLAVLIEPYGWTLDPTSPYGRIEALDGSALSVQFFAVDDDGSETGATVDVTLEVDDGFGTATDDTSVRILNVAPTLEELEDQEVECPNEVTVGPVVFTDPGVLDTHTATVDWDDGSDVEDLGDVESGFEATHLFDHVGTYEVIITVTDDDGGEDVITTTIVMVDTTPPDVSTSVEVDTLWSPNNQMNDVGFDLTVEDACDPEPAISVTVYTDEPEDGSPRFAPDAAMEEAPDLELRAQREGSEDGRVYLIVVTGTDASENSAFAVTTVVVPHAVAASKVAEVRAQAAAAKTYFEANGSAPAGFVEIDTFTVR